MAAGLAVAMTGTSVAVVDALPPDVPAPNLSAAMATVGTPITVSATATDPGGVAAMEYSLDGSPWVALQAGDGTFDGTTETGSATLDDLGQRVVSVAAGAIFTCALLADHTIRCWGGNDFGQLGVAAGPRHTTPVTVTGITTATAIAAGYAHVCALLADTTVSCWGYGVAGQLGDGLSTTRATPGPVPGLTGVTAIAAAGSDTCAVTGAGGVVCWGVNVYGHIGVDPGSLGAASSPTVISGLTGVTGIGVGERHACAITTGGGVSCWGQNGSGQLGDGSTTSSYAPVVVDIGGIVSISPGFSHTCAVSGTGTASCWGYGLDGELGGGVAIAYAPTPLAVQGVSTATMVSSGTGHSCVRLAGGGVSCWGFNLAGEVGTGTFSAGEVAPITVALPAGLAAAGVAAGGEHSCAVLDDGTARCWGSNLNAEIGDGEGLADRYQPVATVGMPGPLAAGSHEVCVRASDTVDNVSDGTACTSFALTPPDTSGPIFSKAAAVAVRVGAALPLATASTPIPVTVAWTASDAGSGVATYLVERSVAGGPFAVVATIHDASATGYATTMPASGLVAFRVTAIDGAGNHTPSTTPTLRPGLLQQSATAVVKSGTWRTVLAGSYSGGSDVYGALRGATATCRVTARAVALVSQKGPGRGYAWIYVDNVLKARVDLYRASTQSRVVVWQYGWASSGGHTIRVWVAGTSGRPRVDVDALVVVK